MSSLVPPGMKGYRLYDLQTKQFFISRNVIFHEHIFPFHASQSNHTVVNPFIDIVLPSPNRDFPLSNAPSMAHFSVQMHLNLIPLSLNLTPVFLNLTSTFLNLTSTFLNLTSLFPNLITMISNLVLITFPLIILFLQSL